MTIYYLVLYHYKQNSIPVISVRSNGGLALTAFTVTVPANLIFSAVDFIGQKNTPRYQIDRPILSLTKY